MLMEVVGVVFLYFFLFFIAGTILKNNSIVDFGWGIGFVLIAVYSNIRTGNTSLTALMVTFLVALWGGRLFYHIFKRNVGKPEDFRYANWRKEWGKWVVPRSFLQVYMLQGLFMLMIAFPIVLIHEKGTGDFNTLTLVGLLVWILGYFFEVVGDSQLKKFKLNPQSKGKLMTTGLWSITRHPNYFGEATMWWGIYIIALSVGVSWWAVISPVGITWLLRFVSGVPMLEKSMQERPGFHEYASKTNAFIPWFPKK